ncbi:FAD-dependent monooxygenase [Pseudochelatococcus sp. G4_1912]|uniref:FAD-dependent monooxygenase n=1 Tax=Pseudochelatococcus sp. G4_1912 TaxID=3114288 RepID=UPI0039C6E76B
MSNSTDPIIVAGAGIGGLTVALMLARRGIPVTIIEKRTALVEAGAGIQISPNASRILIDLGLGAALGRRAVEPKQLDIRSLKNGRRLGVMPLGEKMRTRHGAPYWVILRADLHDVLLDAVRADSRIKLLVGRQVTGVTDHDDHASVQIENTNGALQTVNTPLFIGADGVWSQSRRHVGDGDEPRFRNFEAWRCVISHDTLPEKFRTDEMVVWLGPNAHIVLYPVSGGTAWNIIVIVRSDENVQDWGLPMDRERFENFVAKLSSPTLSDLHELLSAGENWRLWSLHDALPAIRWSTNHATLLGDAAHPVLPFLAQGGALAIEDAAVLVKSLGEHPGNTSAALNAYEQERYPRVRRVMEEARANGRSFHFSGPIAMVRNMLLRRFSGEYLNARYDWLYGWRMR